MPVAVQRCGCMGLLASYNTPTPLPVPPVTTSSPEADQGQHEHNQWAGRAAGAAAWRAWCAFAALGTPLCGHAVGNASVCCMDALALLCRTKQADVTQGRAGPF